MYIPVLMLYERLVEVMFPYLTGQQVTGQVADPPTQVVQAVQAVLKLGN